ncbi:hypothetical protein BSL82_05870 [Tardibacter chloracetimidivorans]|uniref:3'-5' exoribonuclease Rv2179c-like domain-containing protein n=1 Tax=Tardibacter chloracetimidivorans TaxID=1921510 RepID=A0A1L3ZTE7_9SPHN|nr:3'-5' exonuclease [Tardibacter chloracetimidivorans]API58897.1 hypothetical protein BSL82_05870 [Tardibacter chloracetimidivorans]
MADHTHIMVDLETLGTAAGCTILSIGAVAFNPLSGMIGGNFYCNVDRASCEAIGLKTNPATVAWWAQQSVEARAALEANPYPIDVALDAFSYFYRDNDGTHLWGHGGNFDAPVLESAFIAAGMDLPWKYSAARCTRTIYELAGVAPDRMKGVHHNALDDAINQAAAVIAAYGVLKPAMVAKEAAHG